jgi:hypothetical protein
MVSKESIAAIFTVLLLLSQIITRAIYADTSKVIVNPDADVFVNGSPDASRLNMGKKPFYSILEVGIPLSAGQIPGFTGVQLISYIRLNLTDIPNSNFFNDISVDSAELSLVAISTYGSPDRYFVTVSSCSDNSWSEITMTWDTRVCRDHTQVQDSLLIVNDTLPKVYSWDVKSAISNAKHNGYGKITFVVTGFPLTYTTKRRDIVQTNHTGFVRFWSKERSESSDVTGSPKLVVSYATTPTSIMNYLSITAAIVLPILGAIWAASRWILRRAKEPSKSTGTDT